MKTNADYVELLKGRPIEEKKYFSWSDLSDEVRVSLAGQEVATLRPIRVVERMGPMIIGERAANHFIGRPNTEATRNAIADSIRRNLANYNHHIIGDEATLESIIVQENGSVIGTIRMDQPINRITTTVKLD